MTLGKRLISALLIGSSVVAIVSQAAAQQSAGRDAAIHKCIAQAMKSFAGVDQDVQRSEAYKACMTAAGFTP